MVADKPHLRIQGMTLNWHPLVGVRQWQLREISTSPWIVEFSTDAWEMSSSWIDDVLMDIYFRKVQHDMWVRYLTNYGRAWDGRMGMVWVPRTVFVTPAVYLPGSSPNPFRAGLPPPLR